MELLGGGRRRRAQLCFEQRAELVVDLKRLGAVVPRREHFHQVPVPALAERGQPNERARRALGGVELPATDSEAGVRGELERRADRCLRAGDAAPRSRARPRRQRTGGPRCAGRSARPPTLRASRSGRERPRRDEAPSPAASASIHASSARANLSSLRPFEPLLPDDPAKLGDERAQSRVGDGRQPVRPHGIHQLRAGGGAHRFATR